VPQDERTTATPYILRGLAENCAGQRPRLSLFRVSDYMHQVKVIDSIYDPNEGYIYAITEDLSSKKALVRLDIKEKNLHDLKSKVSTAVIQEAQRLDISSVFDEDDYQKIKLAIDDPYIYLITKKKVAQYDKNVIMDK
jgi:hypothetical protein